MFYNHINTKTILKSFYTFVVNNNMLRKIFFTILVVFVFSDFYAQVVKKDNLDIKTFPTGVLYEKIKLPQGNLLRFASQNNLQIKKPIQWLTMYNEISQADFVRKLPHFLSLKQKAKKDLKNNTVDVGILNYRFNKIKDIAFRNGKAKFTSNQLIINDKSVIETKEVFSVSPIIVKKNTGLKINFNFNNDYYFSNKNEQIKYFLIQFDDDKKAQKILNGQKIQVAYSNEGLKHIFVKVYTTKGNVYSSGFDLYVKRIAMPTPDETWSNYSADIPYNGSVAQGEVAVFFGAGNTDFTRPVIVSDGFDPGDIRDLSEIYDIVNQQNMVNQLRSQGYDLVLVNFSGGDDYIQRNAMLIKKVIEDINARMISAGTMKPANQIVVVGPSMSGLVTRYALDYMEQHNIPHNVRNWIAFDSPMKGANVPLGVQHWLRFFAEDADVAGAQDALQTLQGAAAKQMLTYYYTTTQRSTHTAGHHSLYSSFYNEINNMGFPQQTRIVSIINGSGYGNGQPYNPGAKIINYLYRNFWVDLDGDVWAIPNHFDQQILEGVYDVIGFWNYEEDMVYVNNTDPLDSAPGGTRDTFQELADTDTGGHGDITANYPSHAFIPTISSLCIQNTTDPYYNINANINNLQTPFDKLYYPNTNQPHVTITPESVEWFKHEIINYPPQFTSTPATEIDEGDTYSYTFTATDINEWNTINFQVVSLPSWLTYDANTHTLHGIPQYADIGIHSVSIKVDDGLDESTQNFDIRVFPKCTHAPQTVWNGNSWSNGVPDMSKFIVLNSSYNTQVNGAINACSLQIENGVELNINENYPVIIERDLINNGSIHIEDKASLVQTSDKGNISGNGIFSAEKNVSNLTHYYNMVYWSNPLNSNSYTFNDLLSNAWRYYSFDTTNQNWVFETGTKVLQAGIGYVVSAPTGFTGGNLNIEFQKNTDPFNNGIITIPVEITGLGASGDDDWNLLGNPYPSAIDFNQFATDNPNLQGSYSVWTNCAPLNGNNQQEAGYAIYSLIGGISACQNGFTATRYIASEQGFFVEANANGNVNFMNGQRVANNSNFASRSNPMDRIWLDITSEDSDYNQILLAFLPDATNQFDRLYDAKTMYTTNDTYFYALQNNTPLSIMATPLLNDADRSILLGVNNPNEEHFTIHINRFEGELSNKNIYLIDHLLNITTNLKQQDYFFVQDAGTHNNRFELLITNDDLAATPMIIKNEIQVFQNNNLLIIKSLKEKTIQEIKLFDISGREVLSYGNIKKDYFSIPVDNYHNTTFIVNVKFIDNRFINKKVIIKSRQTY